MVLNVGVQVQVQTNLLHWTSDSGERRLPTTNDTVNITKEWSEVNSVNVLQWPTSQDLDFIQHPCKHLENTINTLIRLLKKDLDEIEKLSFSYV